MSYTENIEHSTGTLPGFSSDPGNKNAGDQESNDFFKKIDEVEESYSVLGDLVDKIALWVDEYKAHRAEAEKLKQALLSYNTNIGKLSMFGLREDHLLSYAVEDMNAGIASESALEDSDPLFATALTREVASRWDVHLSRDEILRSVDFSSCESVCDYVMGAINFGDTDDIVLAQLLEEFKRHWDAPYEKFVLKGKKISRDYAIHFSKWDLNDVKFPFQHQDKMKALKALLKRYHADRVGEEQYSNIDSAFSFYHTRHGNSHLFERNGDDSNIDLKKETLHFIKIFKNGKLEMGFPTKEIAKAFFDNYIAKAFA